MDCPMEESTRDLVNHRSISRFGDRFPCFAGRRKPRLFGLLDLGKGLLRGIAKGRTGLKVGQVGNITAVLVAPEDVEIVVPHVSASRGKDCSADGGTRVACGDQSRCRDSPASVGRESVALLSPDQKMGVPALRNTFSAHQTLELQVLGLLPVLNPISEIALPDERKTKRASPCVVIRDSTVLAEPAKDGLSCQVQI